MVTLEKKKNPGLDRRNFMSKVGPGLLSVMGLVQLEEESIEDSKKPSVGLHPQAVCRKKRG